MRKELPAKLLRELLKNSKRSDRDLAKILKVSQPTITRRRARLEKKQILDYTAIPDFGKFGIDIKAFTFLNGKHEQRQEFTQNLRKFISNSHNVIFSSMGYGIGMETIVVSVHRHYADYTRFRANLHDALIGQIREIDSFIVSLSGQELHKKMSFKGLEETFIPR